MDEEETKQEYVEASTLARIIVVGVLLLGLYGVYLILPTLQNLLPQQNAGFAAIDQAIADLTRLLDQLMILSILLAALLSIFFVHLAGQISKSERYPPPHFAVIRRTRIRRGEAVRRFVNLSYLVAALAWFPVLATGYLQWLVASIR
ncbi:MAG: hypothetical protein QNJ69_14200 [Gammaproteobacteria bacterium]|nr:hypothetical protein [Gammaproteobacteria bacterium]